MEYGIEHKKKAVPFLWAFIIAVVVTLIIDIAYHLFLKDSPALAQIAILAAVFSVCLPGILTRSKLQSLGNVFVAPIAWAPQLVGIDTPWGLFTNLGVLVNELLDIMERPGIDVSQSDIDTYRSVVSYAMFVDLVIILFMALIFGFFCAMIATGFFHKDGSFATITIISKPIALIFVLILLPVPIAYHGVAKVGESTVALAAGALVVAEKAEEMGEASVTNIDEVADAFQEAQDYFDTSRKAFDHAQGNFLFMIIMNQVGSTEVQEGVPIEDYIDIADAMLNALFYMTGAAPNLYGGVASLLDGMNQTFDGMGMESGVGRATMTTQSAQSVSQSSNLDPVTFAAGIDLLKNAISNFSAADPDLQRAFDEVEKIFETSAFQEMTEGSEDTASTLKALEALDTLIPTAVEMGNGTIYFVQATFAVLSAVEGLGNNQFQSARDHLVQASANFSIAASIFGEALETLDPALAEADLTNPIWGGIKALANMTTLINHFTNAAINGTDTITAVNATAITLANLNLSKALEDPNDPQVVQDWTYSGNNIDWAAANLTDAGINIGLATETAAGINATDYGSLTDSMHSFATELTNQLGTDSSSGFWGNVTDFGHMMRAVNSTHNAMYTYTRGFNEFKLGLNETAGSLAFNQSMDRSIYWFGLSHENASDGILVFSDFLLETGFPLKENMHIETKTEDMVENANKDIWNASTNSQTLAGFAKTNHSLVAWIQEQMEGNVSLVQIAQTFLAQVFGGTSTALSTSQIALHLSEGVLGSGSSLSFKTTTTPKLAELKGQLENYERIFTPFFLGIAIIAAFGRIKRKH
ncbi:MAG: hypothetical protein ACXAEI_13950 [Candidatus Hodarchaeales archaeon]|jgi:hypothetical protein